MFPVPEYRTAVCIQLWRASSWQTTTCIAHCMVITYSKSKDQPGKVANPARGQLNRGKNEYFPVPVYA